MKLLGMDFLDISDHFTEDELMVQKTAREFVDNEIMPEIDHYFQLGYRKYQFLLRLLFYIKDSRLFSM